MRTYLATLRFTCRLSRSRSQPLSGAVPVARAERSWSPRRIAAGARGDSGISLIEVLVSALLVSIVAVGTLTAFDTAGRASQDQRSHAQASQLAQQDEERLRTLTAAELASLTGTVQSARPEAENGLCIKEVSGNKWEYCTGTAFAGEKYAGTVFKVTPSARYVSASQNGLACETSGGAANYIQTTSSVRWTTLGSARPAVTQSSLVTDNTTGLLVKVFNQAHEPVEGATVKVTGTEPTFSSSQTTSAVGCVIVTGITNKKVTVEASKLSWVDRTGKNPPPTQTVSISPTTAATAEFVMAEPGTIKAAFVSAGSKVSTITSDTIYAFQSNITPPPEDLVGDARPSHPHEIELTKLFPFAQLATPHNPESYVVYAGECSANKPETVTETGEKLTAAKVPVSPGATTAAEIEVPAVNVTAYEGTEATVATEKGKGKTPPVVAKAEPASEIVNSGCAVATAQNAVGNISDKHPVTLTSEGHIEPKYWPYAKKLELCIIAEIPVGKNKFYKYLNSAIENKAKGGTAIISAYMTTAEKKPEYEQSTVKGKLTCP
jgi:Tfp pilus assembly protein PilE